jgi:SprT-like family/Protein of unknown function (DUF2786)
VENEKKHALAQELERRILKGLSCEWDAALWVLPDEHKIKIKKPLFSLNDSNSRWGNWSEEKNEISLNRKLVMNHPWDAVREVLLHEMAHQFADQVFKAGREAPHGPAFKKACRLLRANPKASESTTTLHNRLATEASDRKNVIFRRIKKLLALAESKNQFEAEAAMAKAHMLLAKHHIDTVTNDENREFTSIFIGKPALRHTREVYHLARLLQEFYFVQGIWVPAYVLEKGKMGRVLEISSTNENVKIAHYVFDYIVRFVDSKWAEYNSENRLNRYRKTDFAIGIIEGFRIKLKTEHKRMEKPKNAFMLIEAREDPQLKNYLSYKYPNLTSFRRKALRQDGKILKDGIRTGKSLVISKGIDQRAESSQRRLTKGVKQIAER